MSSHHQTIGDLVALQRGHDLPDTARKPGAIPVVGSAGINGYHNEVKCIGPGVTIGRSGASIGKVFYIERDFWPHNACLYVKDFKGNNPKFVAYLLSTINLSHLNSGAAQPSLNRNFVYGVKTSFPDRPSQDEIVDVLKNYDDLIENNRRRLQLLEESARLLYKEWFVSLRFPGHEHVKITAGVPEGWEKSVVSDLGEVITGKTPSTKDEDNFGDEVPFIKTPDMHVSSIVTFPEEHLSEKGANSQSKKFLPPYSILVACIGAKLGVVTFNRNVAQTNQQINAVIPKKDFLRYFSYFLLESFKPRLQAIGGGATMPNVNKSKFSSLDFFLPTQSLLEMFDCYAQSNFEQMAQLIEMNKKLEEARDILLPRLMNGDLTV